MGAGLRHDLLRTKAVDDPPDGYSDVPAGKIAAVVTHLEMTARPAPRPDPAGAWTLRRVDAPALDWFRDLYRRVGEEWLWFSRIRMPDAELAAIIHSPQVDVYALAHDGRDEGLLELDFREAGQCELVFFGVTGKLDRQRRRPLADEPRAGARMVAAGRAASGCTPAPSIIPSALAFYQRSGFRPFRRQVEVADDPRLDGTAPRDVARHVPIIE